MTLRLWLCYLTRYTAVFILHVHHFCLSYRHTGMNHLVWPVLDCSKWRSSCQVYALGILACVLCLLMVPFRTLCSVSTCVYWYSSWHGRSHSRVVGLFVMSWDRGSPVVSSLELRSSSLPPVLSAFDGQSILLCCPLAMSSRSLATNY